MNRKKTSVAHISKVKYLGYAFYRYKGKCKFRVHSKSVAKMKDKIRELTKRSNGWGNGYRAMKLAHFVRGWVNYFSLADMKGDVPVPLGSYQEEMQKFMDTKVAEGVHYESNAEAFEDFKQYYDKRLKVASTAGVQIE